MNCCLPHTLHVCRWLATSHTFQTTVALLHHQPFVLAVAWPLPSMWLLPSNLLPLAVALSLGRRTTSMDDPDPAASNALQLLPDLNLLSHPPNHQHQCLVGTLSPPCKRATRHNILVLLPSFEVAHNSRPYECILCRAAYLD